MKDLIMEYVRTHNSTGTAPPRCNNFCKHLMLWELKTVRKFKVANTIRDAICNMVVATLGGHEKGSNRTRAIVDIGPIYGPLVTDAYVGVCCKSLQKFCQNVKKNILEAKGSTIFKDAAFDGWVQPIYDDYPFNGAVCANITRPERNPPHKRRGEVGAHVHD